VSPRELLVSPSELFASHRDALDTSAVLLSVQVSFTYRFCGFGAVLHPSVDFTVGTQTVVWDAAPGVCLFDQDLNSVGRVPVAYTEVNEGPRPAQVSRFLAPAAAARFLRRSRASKAMMGIRAQLPTGARCTFCS
jgi:hypothetical protein